MINLWYTDNKHRIEKYYENFLYAIKYLLGYGVQVELIAKRVKEDSNFGPRNCSQKADDFLEFNMNAELIKEVFYSIVQSLEKVSDLRRGRIYYMFNVIGFYCNLCDAQTQQDIHYYKFNPLIDNHFLMNQEFCEHFVSDTIQSAYYQVFYLKPYLEKSFNLMKCVVNDPKIPDLKYSIGFLREKRVKNCYYFNQKYFFFFCEEYCEDFSLIKSAGIVEGDLSEIKPFVEFYNNYKEQLFPSPGQNVLIGTMSYDMEYLMENLGTFAKEVIFFPPMTDDIDLRGFELDVDFNDGVNPYVSAQGSLFNISIANANVIKMGLICLFYFLH